MASTPAIRRGMIAGTWPAGGVLQQSRDHRLERHQHVARPPPPSCRPPRASRPAGSPAASRTGRTRGPAAGAPPSPARARRRGRAGAAGAGAGPGSAAPCAPLSRSQLVEHAVEPGRAHERDGARRAPPRSGSGRNCAPRRPRARAAVARSEADPVALRAHRGRRGLEARRLDERADLPDQPALRRAPPASMPRAGAYA